MKLRTVLVVLLLLAGPASAENDSSFTDFVAALQFSLAQSWLCRDAIGVDHYERAQAYTIDVLAPYAGREKAASYVTELDKRLKADPRAVQTSTIACLEGRADAIRKVMDAKARLQSKPSPQ